MDGVRVASEFIKGWVPSQLFQAGDEITVK